jgi:hypothetical protein
MADTDRSTAESHPLEHGHALHESGRDYYHVNDYEYHEGILKRICLSVCCPFQTEGYVVQDAVIL